MMYMAKKGEMAVKKWGFSGEMQVIGSEKMVSGQPNRKAKWCKMQVVGVKWA